MLGLNVQKFWEIKPKLPFRFKADFFTGDEKLDKILSIALTNISMPKIEGQISEGSMFLGNTNFIIPTWNIASRKMDITFEETNNMDITTYIDYIINKSYGRSPIKNTIVIHEFDKNMYLYSSTCYVCHLGSYTEPEFKRDGNAGQLTITISYIIDGVIENWDGNLSDIVTGISNITNTNTYNEDIAISYNDEDALKRANESGGSGSNVDPSGGTTRDFNVSQKETDDVFAKIQQSQYKDKVSKEDLQAVQIENAKRMETAYDKFKRLMKENGYNVSINAYNDTGHELGIGTESGSHLLGQKIDLTMMDKNNNKLTPDNMKKEDLDKIVELAHQAGLTPNWETTGNAGSGWGDFALAEAKSIDKQGKVVDLTTKTWTGEKSAFNTGEKSYQEMGKA